MAPSAEIANQVANAWGPTLTKAFKEEDVSGFRAMFVTDQPVGCILNGPDGGELEFTVGDDAETATLTWDEFLKQTCQDLKAQDFSKTESQCLGMLGDRIILESGRFNSSGEVYHEGYMLVTLNDEGKILLVEAFAGIGAASLEAMATAKKK